MSDLYILDDDGQPVKVSLAREGVLRWAEWMQSHDRHVGDTTIGRVRISTIFLGIDHNFARWIYPNDTDTPPILWETMIFGGELCGLDGMMTRYSSYEAAKGGHILAVETVRRAIEVVKN